MNQRNDKPPQRPAPVQRMLDVLFDIETGTRELLDLVTEAMRLYHDGDGLPDQPIRFAWGRTPDPERDRQKQRAIIAEREAEWREISPAHAKWSRLHDQIYYVVQEWRAALDTARALIPAVAPWTDDKEKPEIERWSAKFRGELSLLGGVVHRVMIGDLPYLELGTINGLRHGLESMQRRSDDLKNVGPDAVPVAAGSLAAVAPPRPGAALASFWNGIWDCHDILSQIVKRQSPEEPPLSPAMVAELRTTGRLALMGMSPREESVYRFRTETRKHLDERFERALVEARDHAGGAAGEIVALLRRAMNAMDALAEAAVRVPNVHHRTWSDAEAEFQRVSEEIVRVRALVERPPIKADTKGEGGTGSAGASEDWFSSSTLKDRCGLTPDQLQKMAERDRLHPEKRGKLLWYRRSELREVYPEETKDL